MRLSIALSLASLVTLLGVLDMPLYYKPQPPKDKSVDDDYLGLADEVEKETLSLTEMRALRFVQWGLSTNKGHFHEFLLEDDEDY